jgi:serine/threonine-protein kinase
MRVPANGGVPESIAVPNRDANELGYEWPDALPGGRVVLFTIQMTGARSAVALRDLDTGAQKVVIPDGSHARYVTTGHVVYAASGGLWAVPFDTATLSVAGSAIPLPEPVTVKPSGAALFNISRSGSLAYISGANWNEQWRLVWIDRLGNEELIQAPPRAYRYPRISPDGRRAAVDVRDQENDIWIWDFVRQTLNRFRFDPGPDSYPVWSPDGRRIAFGAPGGLFWRASDGSGTVERMTQTTTAQQPYAFTRDGTKLIVRELGISVVTLPEGTSTVLLDRTSPSEPTPLNAELSPDGRWIAYQATVAGRAELFVRPFPRTDQGRWQISTSGGSTPLWARSGRELFFLTPNNALMRVLVQLGDQFSFSTPDVLIKDASSRAGELGRTYDVSPDGNRFLFVRDSADRDAGQDGAQLNLVLNWAEELRRLAPVKK